MMPTNSLAGETNVKHSFRETVEAGVLSMRVQRPLDVSRQEATFRHRSGGQQAGVCPFPSGARTKSAFPGTRSDSVPRVGGVGIVSQAISCHRARSSETAPGDGETTMWRLAPLVRCVDAIVLSEPSLVGPPDSHPMTALRISRMVPGAVVQSATIATTSGKDALSFMESRRFPESPRFPGSAALDGF